MMLGSILASAVHADPADDALAKLNELSRQAEQATEAMHTAQLDLDAKTAAQAAADNKYIQDQAAVNAAQVQLATFQGSVDNVAAAMYMGGRTDGLAAILTAGSPQGLIDKLAMQRVMATEMSSQMANYRKISAEAVQAQEASAKSAAEAKTAAQQAAAVRADLQAKQSQLQLQIAVVKSQYQALTPSQRVALAAPGPVPPPEAAPGPDVLAAGPPGALPPDALPPAPEALPAAPAPPEGIPPGDMAPPEGAVQPGEGGGAPEGAIAVQAALTRVGAPYSWGAGGPGAFDCSGLVMWAFQQAGISLPHSSQALAAGGQSVSRDALQPGDVVNFYSDASHTGIYVGDGMVVHASTYGQPVKVVPLDGAGPFYNARRY
ncbi:MAG: C40 family peptidase [Mycobacterium sp.]|nr:C40 family peptidase [Mycobacterium sp.]